MKEVWPSRCKMKGNLISYQRENMLKTQTGQRTTRIKPREAESMCITLKRCQFGNLWWALLPGCVHFLQWKEEVKEKQAPLSSSDEMSQRAAKDEWVSRRNKQAHSCFALNTSKALLSVKHKLLHVLRKWGWCVWRVYQMCTLKLSTAISAAAPPKFRATHRLPCRAAGGRSVFMETKWARHQRWQRPTHVWVTELSRISTHRLCR